MTRGWGFLAPVTVLVVLVAGCLDSLSSDGRITRIEAGVFVGDDIAILRGAVYRTDGAFESVTAWEGDLQATWTATEPPDAAPWTATYRIDADDYVQAGMGPFFERTLLAHQLPPPGCYVVTIGIKGSEGLVGPELVTCTDPAETFTPVVTGPSYGLVSDSTTSSPANWTVKVASATDAQPLTAFLFVLTGPEELELAASAPQRGFANQFETYCPTNGHSCVREAPQGPGPLFRFVWTDMDGDENLSIGDVTTITYEADGEGEWTDPFPRGAYEFEILHVETGSSSAMLPRTF